MSPDSLFPPSKDPRFAPAPVHPASLPAPSPKPDGPGTLPDARMSRSSPGIDSTESVHPQPQSLPAWLPSGPVARSQTLPCVPDAMQLTHFAPAPASPWKENSPGRRWSGPERRAISACPAAAQPDAPSPARRNRPPGSVASTNWIFFAPSRAVLSPRLSFQPRGNQEKSVSPGITGARVCRHRPRFILGDNFFLEIVIGEKHSKMVPRHEASPILRLPPLTETPSRLPRRLRLPRRRVKGIQ